MGTSLLSHPDPPCERTQLRAAKPGLQSPEALHTASVLRPLAWAAHVSLALAARSDLLMAAL